MKKSALLLFLVTSLVVLSWVVLGISSSHALAQATEETPAAVATTEIPLPTTTVNTIVIPPSNLTPDPTVTMKPDLTMIKWAELDNDLNKNGNIDPGEVVRYKIRILNNGAELSNLVIQDTSDWNNFKFPDLDNVNCSFTGDKIECKLDTLLPGETVVSYKVTLRDALDFKGISSIEIKNTASILMSGIVLATASTAFQVSVPTPTPTLTWTPTPTWTPEATGTPTPTWTPEPTKVPSGASALGQNWPSTILVVLLAFVGIAVFTYMGGLARLYSLSDIKTDNPELVKNIRDDEKEMVIRRLTIFREGVIIIFIVSTVLLMGIAGTLQSDGVISLLSAVVGYVFGRASSRG